MNRAAAWLAVLGCALAPGTPAAESLECMLSKSGWRSQWEGGDLKAAARHFSTLARECADSLRGPVRDDTPRFIDALQGAELRAARLDALGALFDAGYRGADDEQPNDWWLELVRDRIDRQDTPGATAVAGRIDAIPTLLAMRADRRFDSLRQSAPEHFDLAAAQQRLLLRLRAQVDARPASLEARVKLADGLLSVGRYPDAASLIDSALAAGGGVFADWKQQVPWALVARGFAQWGQQQHATALRDLRAAFELAREREDRGYFAINLALLQVRLGQADDALATLRSSPRTNAQGDLLVASIQQRAFLLRGDPDRANGALQRMQDLQAAKPALYWEALLRANRIDAAREHLLERLSDPERRAAALQDIQDFHNPPPTAEQRPTEQRKRQLLALPVVREAIDRVGRVESVPFPES